MNLYKVTYSRTVDYVQEVEAESEEAAFDAVYNGSDAFNESYEENSWDAWDDAVIELLEEGEDDDNDEQA
jgi:hypothetical protein